MGEVEADPARPPRAARRGHRRDRHLYLVDRGFLDRALAGRFGYGRALLHRRPLRSLLRLLALVLPAGPAGVTRPAPRWSGRTR